MDRGEEALWVVEGGANYFVNWMVLNRQGRLDELGEALSAAAAQAIAESGPELVDPGIAEKGAAVLLRLVCEGLLDEQAVLDASLFHGCEWAARFTGDGRIVAR